MRRFVHRLLRASGLHVERHRDLFTDLARMAPDLRCAIDGGAYHGKASRDLLGLFPGAQVHAFEPQPDLFEPLQAAARDNPRWHVHRLALSDVEGEATFHVPQGQAYTGSLLTPGSAFAPAAAYTVPVAPLAAWAGRNGIAPDFLKFDLQGAELRALKGAAPLLPGVRAVAVEVNFVPRYEGCARFGEVASFLEGEGFHLHRLYEIHSKRSGQWEFADALFLRTPLGNNEVQ